MTSMDHFRNVVTNKYDIEHYIPTILKNNIHLKLLCVKSKLSKNMKTEDKEQKRETKFLPEKFNIKNTMFIFDDKVALISNERYPVCIMITSKEISDMMRTNFMFMWEHSE